MITRHLWLALRYPPRQHPLFQWGMRQSLTVTRRWLLWSVVGVCVLAFLILVATSPLLAFSALVAFSVVTPALLLLGNGTVLGAMWSIRVQLALYRLYSQHGELLDSTLAGGWDGAWLVARAVVHQGHTFEQAYRVVRAVTLSLILGVAFASGLIILNGLTSRNVTTTQWLTSLNTIAPYGALLTVLWFDHLQSTLMGCLIGMINAKRPILPTFIWVTAVGSFVTAQLFVYLLSLVCYVGLERVFQAWLGDKLYMTPFSLAMIGVFFVIREAVLWSLIQWTRRLYPE